MKTHEFLAKYNLPFDQYTYIKQFDEMSQAWDQSHKPLLLIDILKHLDNPNYDLPLIDYVVRVSRRMESLVNTYGSKKLINKGIDALQSYYDGLLDPKEFEKRCDLYGTTLREIIQNDAIPKKEKRLMFAVGVGMLWLIQGKKPIFAALNITKHISNDEITRIYADLLRDCVGNPFLT